MRTAVSGIDAVLFNCLSSKISSYFVTLHSTSYDLFSSGVGVCVCIDVILGGTQGPDPPLF